MLSWSWQARAKNPPCLLMSLASPWDTFLGTMPPAPRSPAGFGVVSHPKMAASSDLDASAQSGQRSPSPPFPLTALSRTFAAALPAASGLGARPQDPTTSPTSYPHPLPSPFIFLTPNQSPPATVGGSHRDHRLPQGHPPDAPPQPHTRRSTGSITDVAMSKTTEGEGFFGDDRGSAASGSATAARRSRGTGDGEGGVEPRAQRDAVPSGCPRRGKKRQGDHAGSFSIRSPAAPRWGWAGRSRQVQAGPGRPSLSAGAASRKAAEAAGARDGTPHFSFPTGESCPETAVISGPDSASRIPPADPASGSGPGALYPYGGDRERLFGVRELRARVAEASRGLPTAPWGCHFGRPSPDQRPVPAQPPDPPHGSASPSASHRAEDGFLGQRGT